MSRPRVQHCAHWIWSPDRGQHEIPCPAHLFVVVVGDKHHRAQSWQACMDLANMVARAARLVEVAS